MSCTPARFDEVADYVDGLLSRARAEAFERHLVVCQHCAGDVAEQRELVARMRAVAVDSSRRDSLIAGLLDLGELPTEPSPVRHPSGPMTVTCGAPPQYVSARRSVGLAAVAVAGCAGIALMAAHIPVAPTSPTATQVVNEHPTGSQAHPAVIGADQLGSRAFVQVAAFQTQP